MRERFKDQPDGFFVKPDDLAEMAVMPTRRVRSVDVRTRGALLWGEFVNRDRIGPTVGLPPWSQPPWPRPMHFSAALPSGLWAG